MDTSYRLLVLAVIVTLVIALKLQGYKYKTEAVERGYAEYCPDTDNWAWKGECEK